MPFDQILFHRRFGKVHHHFYINEVKSQWFSLPFKIPIWAAKHLIQSKVCSSNKFVLHQLCSHNLVMIQSTPLLTQMIKMVYCKGFDSTHVMARHMFCRPSGVLFLGILPKTRNLNTQLQLILLLIKAFHHSYQ